MINGGVRELPQVMICNLLAGQRCAGAANEGNSMDVRNIWGLGVAILIIAGSPQASAQDAQHPAIADYGAITPLPEAAHRPLADQPIRALFEVSSDASGPEGVYRGLDKVARFLNLLASAGVEPHQAQVKVIIHGAATSLVMNDDAYRDRFGTANPQAKVIEALQGAGVELHVCGQALARQNIPSDDVAPGITIDLSAITTLVLLQQRGWSLVPD